MAPTFNTTGTAGVVVTGLTVLCVMLVFGTLTVGIYKGGEWLIFKILSRGFLVLLERRRRDRG